MRIGVMTGGGDCAGLNAAIRAVVLASMIHHDIEVVGILNGYEGLIEHQTMPLGRQELRGILRIGGTILGSSNRTNPFKYTDHVTGESVDASGRAANTVSDLGLDGLVVIGGDGTLTLSNIFAERYGIPLVGIPKTIDNDVPGTEYSIGFDTAVSIVAEAIDRLHTTAESHHRVMLVEVMGRTAGWISLFSGVAGGADIVLIPERRFEFAGVVDAIDRRRQVGRHFTIATVAEGAMLPSGERVYRSKSGETYEWKLGGVCDFLAARLEDMSRQEVRTIVLGHLQRGGIPTAFDRNLASMLGVRAVQVLADRQGGTLVGWDGHEVTESPISVASAGPQLVPANHPLIATADALGIYIG
ncbi:MAG: 6-phosphofructokinase [Chloroflexota bacterium]